MKDQHLKFSSLSPKWQTLIRIMQRLNFGELHNLIIEGGEPTLGIELTTIVEYRLGRDNGARSEFHLDDYVLSNEMVEFMGFIQELDSIEIKRVVVKHGLPFLMEIEHLV